MIIKIGGVDYGIGLPEFLIILTIFAIAVGFPTFITLLLRKKKPNTLWVGLLLSFVFCPFGQFYLKKSWLFFIPLLTAYLFILFSQVASGWLILSGVSASIMYFRLKKTMATIN